MNKGDVYHNNELAFRIGEQYLGIPALLEAEDMVEYEIPDRLSIITYLAQFFQAFGESHGNLFNLHYLTYFVFLFGPTDFKICLKNYFLTSIKLIAFLKLHQICASKS